MDPCSISLLPDMISWRLFRKLDRNTRETVLDWGRPVITFPKGWMERSPCKCWGIKAFHCPCGCERGDASHFRTCNIALPLADPLVCRSSAGKSLITAARNGLGHDTLMEILLVARGTAWRFIFLSRTR